MNTFVRQRSRFDMQFVTSCISTTMVLLLLGMVVFFVQSAGNLSVYVRENISFSALMSDDMREADILKFQKKLEAEPYVKSTAYISKEQALREETEAMGTNPQEFVGHNPFTASVEINLHSDYANADSIAWIEKSVMQMAKVVEIVYPEELIDVVNKNVRKISLVLLTLAALLTIISFSLINNTIRLTIYAKRFLIHTMKLVGADWNFIRKPFLVRNLWVGLISALCADGLLMTGGYWLVRYEPELINVITTHTMLTVILTVLLSGITITLLCAYISINRYLRMKSETLYYA
ncbi:MAG: permease-like cell division protein FtsX [Bacteroidaceae bacterium]|nr:permease-like cell division protein FtsX [Bacteroidaceae bacterium]